MTARSSSHPPPRNTSRTAQKTSHKNLIANPQQQY